MMEFPLWHSGLRIPLQWLGSLQRCGFNPQSGAVGLRILHCHICGVGRSCGSDTIPGPGTSICSECGHLKKKKRISSMKLSESKHMGGTSALMAQQVSYFKDQGFGSPSPGGTPLTSIKFSSLLDFFHLPSLGFAYQRKSAHLCQRSTGTESSLSTLLIADSSALKAPPPPYPFWFFEEAAHPVMP